MICGKAKFSAIVGGFFCLLLQKIQSVPVTVPDFGPAVYHGALIGSYAGQLSGGVALSKLNKFDVGPYKIDESNFEKTEKEEDPPNEEEHDFSEGAAKNSPSLYETVGEMGDHLNEKDFPGDYEAEGEKEEEEEEEGEKKAEEYEEREAQEGAASELHEGLEENRGYYSKEPENNQIEADFVSFLSKPVPGIDHGKGAYSYSTTYEFPKQ